MRRLPISPLLAPPFGCGLPWWPFCLGFEQIWGNFDFQPHCPTHTGAEKRPSGVLCKSTQFSRRTGRLSILTAPSLQNPTWFAPGVLILTRLALGAPRRGGLCGAARGWALTKTMVPMRSRERPLGPRVVAPGHAPQLDRPPRARPDTPPSPPTQDAPLRRRCK